MEPCKFDIDKIGVIENIIKRSYLMNFTLGPYVQSLLGMSYELAKEYESILLEDDRLDRTHLRRGQSEYSEFEILRPGFSRYDR